MLWCIFLPPPSVGGLDLDSRSSGCARLGGGVGPPLGVVVEEVAVLVVLVRRHCGVFQLSCSFFTALDAAIFLSQKVTSSDFRFSSQWYQRGASQGRRPRFKGGRYNPEKYVGTAVVSLTD